MCTETIDAKAKHMQAGFSLVDGDGVNNTAVTASNCYLRYYRATSSAPPSVDYVTSSC